MDFAAHVAPGHPRYLPRGREPWEGAFTFFRRNADRSIDETNLAERAREMARLLDVVLQRHHQPALLIGFSSGAITAAALMATHPGLIAGAVLLRPQSPFGEKVFPNLNGVSILILSGEDDRRRTRSDGELLYNQLLASGATVTWHNLPCGHDFDAQGHDIELTRAWVAQRG
ncbi:alpha/beta hydrolase [Rhizobium sp. WL3]|uniref:alpha/beta hydrolase n=1 Tax=Rhizobium sp. WL3 TaxID=2603277 RepID=UPI0011C1DB62|nr:alpha/beta hydrolase [Rhizobium sp. WL3]QEE44281.1 alpha/beta hydrolase [Rhizobium sp. WL3]